MKKILILFFGVVALSSIAFSKTTAPASKASEFTKHSYEFQVTPSADYLIYRQGSSAFAHQEEPYKTRYPFIGFGFGVNYIFRPIKVVGVSAGFNIKMQGSYSRVTSYAPMTYISSRGNAHVGFISIPIQAHLYKEMSDCTFEFAIGPEFNIPIFDRRAYALYSPNGEKVASDKDSDKYNSDQIRYGASFGLSFLLGGEMHLCEHANLFVGPQFQFLNLVRFDKDRADAEKAGGRFYDVSLGVKLGFRFH